MRFARLIGQTGGSQRARGLHDRGPRQSLARRLRTLVGSTTPVLLGLGAMTFATGCDTKSFFDPSEMGRYDHQPLLKTILDKVDPALEEANPEFANAVPPAAEDMVVSNLDYRISRNDLIQVEIIDLGGPGINTQKTDRVSESGQITLPNIGQLKADGLTEIELEQRVNKEYADQGILKNAQVSVTVIEARGRVFSMLGAVNQPGQYAIIDPDFRLLDALVLARDTITPLVEDVYIIRRTDLAQRGPAAPGGTDVGNPATPPKATTAPATGPAVDDLAPRGANDRLNPTGRLAQMGSTADRFSPARFGPIGPVKSRTGVQHLQVDAPAATAPAATAPAAVEVDPLAPKVTPAPAGTPDDSDPKGRFIWVDGKRMLISGPEAATATAAPTDVVPGPAAGVTPGPVPAAAPAAAPAPGTLATATPGGRFEFNDLPAPDNIKVIHIPLNRLRNGEMQYNVVVRPKDTIVVQNLPVGEYYMGGHVARPGAYSLTARRISLKQAIIAANMLDQLAIPERTDIIRRIGRNREVFVRVNLAKIFAGEQADIFLKPDDQVMVGTNALAPFLAAARGAFRLTYGAGFLYDRNYAVDEEQQFR